MFWKTYQYIPVIHTGMFHQYIPVCIFAALLIRRRAATRRQGGSKALPPAFLTLWRNVFRTCIAAQAEEYSLLYARNMPAAFLHKATGTAMPHFVFILLLQMRITLYLRRLDISYPVFALNYAVFTQNHNEGAEQLFAMTFTKPLRRPRCPGSACGRSCSGCQSHSSRWGRELRTGGFLLSPDKGSRLGLGCC